MTRWLRERLKWWVAGAEMQALHRYQVACGLAWRWNGRVPNSSETADWIRQVGDGKRGMDIEQFRDRLERKGQ